MRRIVQISADQIRGHPSHPRHPRSMLFFTSTGSSVPIFGASI